MSWCGERKITVDYSEHDKNEHPIINARLDAIEKKLEQMADTLNALSEL